MADDTGQEPGRLSDENWELQLVASNTAKEQRWERARAALRADRTAILATLRTTREENERLNRGLDQKVTHEQALVNETSFLAQRLASARDREARLVAALREQNRVTGLVPSVWATYRALASDSPSEEER